MLIICSHSAKVSMSEERGMQPWPTLAWRVWVFRASIKRCEMKGKVPSNLSMELCSLINPRLNASRNPSFEEIKCLAQVIQSGHGRTWTRTLETACCVVATHTGQTEALPITAVWARVMEPFWPKRFVICKMRGRTIPQRRVKGWRGHTSEAFR